MRITSVIPIEDFKLILEFDNNERRMLDVKKYLENDKGLLAEVRDDIDMFETVEIDDIAGTVCWANGVDFDPEMLYQNSVEIDGSLA